MRRSFVVLQVPAMPHTSPGLIAKRGKDQACAPGISRRAFERGRGFVTASIYTTVSMCADQARWRITRPGVG